MCPPLTPPFFPFPVGFLPSGASPFCFPCVFKAEEQRKANFFRKHGEHEEKRRVAHLRYVKRHAIVFCFVCVLCLLPRRYPDRSAVLASFHRELLLCPRENKAEDRRWKKRRSSPFTLPLNPIHRLCPPWRVSCSPLLQCLSGSLSPPPLPRPPAPGHRVFLKNNSSEEERQLLARQRFLQEKKRMIILDESRAEEQARKEAGLARIEQVTSS